MLSKNRVSYIRSLRQGKFRELNKAFIAEGVKMVEELIKSSFRIQTIFGLASWFEPRKEMISGLNLSFLEISEDELKKISNLTSPSEVLAVVEIPDPAEPLAEELGNLVLVLDYLQDPGNLGTIIRIADWFGIGHVICTPGTVDVYNPKVIQATMGSVFRVKVHYLKPETFFQSLSPSWQIYGSASGGDNIYKTELNYPAAVVIGNESQGISPETNSFIHQWIGIPSFSDAIESLNASVATGIICSEFRRRGGNK